MPWKAEGSTGNKQNLNLSADAFTVLQMDELAFIGKEKQLQRPAPFEKEADGIYRFKCSANQASNYFSSFGANAVILEPKRLRDRMRKMYEDAFLRYQQETEEENKKPRTAGQPDARGE